MNVMNNMSYGLFVLTAKKEGFDNGCIINTAQQVTSEPNCIAITVNKTNLTHDMIMDTGKFNISIISEKADFDLFKHFGFQSGRDVNKFDNYEDSAIAENGVRYITKGVNSYISAEVKQVIDIGTHTMFIANVTAEKQINEDASATYSYYHANIKPQPVDTGKKKDGQTVWRCVICGYEYVGEELPDDFICPLCKHPASDFEKVIV